MLGARDLCVLHLTARAPAHQHSVGNVVPGLLACVCVHIYTNTHMPDYQIILPEPGRRRCAKLRVRLHIFT